MNNLSPSSRRRNFLAAIGAVSATALAGCSSSSTDPTNADFTFRKLDEAHTLADEKHVLLSQQVLEEYRDLEPLQQIRLGKGRMSVGGESDEDGDSDDGEDKKARPQNPAVFTIRETQPIDPQPQDVYLSKENLELIGVEDGDSASFVDFAPNPDISSRSSAEQNNEYIENQINEGDADLCAIAPHGGGIYPRTAEQAARVASQMDAAAWRTMAFEEDEETLRQRWYVSANVIHPESYFELENLMGSFQYCVSFSGFDEQPSETTGDGIAIGGLVPDDTLETVASGVRDALNDAGADDVEVWSYPTGASENPSANHLANRITESGRNGIQITSTSSIRASYWHVIANGVIDAMEGLLEESSGW